MICLRCGKYRHGDAELEREMGLCQCNGRDEMSDETEHSEHRDHEYADVRADIAQWLPKLKPQGVLIGRDYELPTPLARRVQRETKESEQKGKPMTTQTLGPWRVDRFPCCCRDPAHEAFCVAHDLGEARHPDVDGPSATPLAKLLHAKGVSEIVALGIHKHTDARLIAAAPNLLAACREVLADIRVAYNEDGTMDEKNFVLSRAAVRQVEAAVANAISEQPSPG